MTAVYNEADGNASGDSRISLQQIAGALTELEPFGTGWWRGDCPLCHEVEAGPAAGSSFMVFPNGGNGEEAFKCERCDESGYVDDFLRLRFSQAPRRGRRRRTWATPRGW
jgi:hypothetical protein